MVGDSGGRMSRALAAHSLLGAGLNALHSLRARGLKRTLLFIVLGGSISLFREYMTTNVFRALRHRTEPQVKGISPSVALARYNLSYSSMSVMESILVGYGADETRRRRMLPLSTALVVTSMESILDCLALDRGLWQWQTDGTYAMDIEGPNGKRGVPWLNFTGWITLIMAVIIGYQRILRRDEDIDLSYPGGAGTESSGRTAALLLLPYYLPAVAWALKRGKTKYLLYSALLPAAILLALKGRSSNP